MHSLLLASSLAAFLLSASGRSSTSSRNMQLGGKECLEAPFSSGHCEPPEVAWSFDPARRSCQSFQYTGCGPSANVFNSRKECELRCDRFAKVKVSASVPMNTDRIKREAISTLENFFGPERNLYYLDVRRHLNRICFKRYMVDEREDCKLYPKVRAWHYDQNSSSCRQYEICAKRELFFTNRHECMQRCEPLFKHLLDSVLRLVHHRQKEPLRISPSFLLQSAYGDSTDFDRLIDQAIADKIKTFRQNRRRFK